MKNEDVKEEVKEEETVEETVEQADKEETKEKNTDPYQIFSPDSSLPRNIILSFISQGSVINPEFLTSYLLSGDAKRLQNSLLPSEHHLGIRFRHMIIAA